jgi:hypothetical protein
MFGSVHIRIRSTGMVLSLRTMVESVVFEFENIGGERAVSSSQLIPMLCVCCRATMLNYSSKLLLTSDFSIEGQLGN